MKKIICIHAVIHGKVQGVFYRDSTRQQAKALGITGWVKNNKDGTVELQACGQQDSIDQLVEWLKKGPPRAQVSKVDWAEEDEGNHKEFAILR
jgi:acylphosphatase